MESKAKKIKRHLLRGDHITSLDALKLYGHSRLAVEINRLRKTIPVDDVWVQVDDARFKRYFVPQDYVNSLKAEEHLKFLAHLKNILDKKRKDPGSVDISIEEIENDIAIEERKILELRGQTIIKF
jgi:hypothetical protein